MSLTSYRAAPPRDKWLQSPLRESFETEDFQRLKRRPDRRMDPEKASRTMSVVRRLCINGTSVWKGLKAAFFTIYRLQRRVFRA